MNSDQVMRELDLKRTQINLAKLQRREWWSWGAALTIIALLTAAVAVLGVSSVSDQLLTATQRDLVVRGLVPLVVIFGLFSIRQQVLIGNLRKQLATQIGVSATIEALRPPDAAQQSGWENRRLSPRYYFDQRVKVFAGSDTFHGRTRDISEGGIGVVIPDDVPTGSRVKLEFAVEGANSALTVEGILRHHRGFYNGFEFVDLTPAMHELIKGACTGEEVPDIRQRQAAKA